VIQTSRYSWTSQTGVPDGVLRAIDESRARVIGHPIYTDLRTVEDLKVFMEHHVFAVWDFMSLLTALQRRFTCVELPWRPRGSPLARRLVNEITLIEESDEIDSVHTSHFELYLSAMDDVGADTTTIRAVVDRAAAGDDVHVALAAAGAPASIRRFVGSTWDVVDSAPDHVLAAVFALTREDLIPDMFEQVVAGMDDEHAAARFLTYLDRHIAVDADEHTPMAMALLASLCTEDQHWQDCVRAAVRGLDERFALWTAISTALVGQREVVAP